MLKLLLQSSLPPLAIALASPKPFSSQIPRQHRYLWWFLSALIFTVLLQSCSVSRLATDCERLQQATYVPPYTASTLISEPVTDKSASVFASKQQTVLANQLARIPLLDQTLSDYRNDLVTLYRHDSDLGLQITAFMTDAGEISVSGGSRTAYEQVAGQRIAINQQVQNINSLIVGYCSSSEF